MDLSFHTDNDRMAYLYHHHHHHLQQQRQQQQLLHHQHYPRPQHRQRHYHHNHQQAQQPQGPGRNFYDLEPFDRKGVPGLYSSAAAAHRAYPGVDSNVYSVNPGADTMFSLGRPQLHGGTQFHPQFNPYSSSDMQAYRQSQQRVPLGVSVRIGKPPQKPLSKRKSTKDKKKKNPAGKMTDTKVMGAASNLTSEYGPGWCSVCQRDCVTAVALRQHLEGKVHRKQIERQKLKTELIASKLPPLEDTGILKQVWMHVSSMAKASQTGNPRKKQKTAEAGKDGPSSNAVPNSEGDFTIRKRKSKAGKDLQPTVVNSMEEPSTPKKNVVDKLRCKLCNVECNSQTVLDIHLGGRKHAAQVKKVQESTAASNPQANNVVNKQESSDKVV